MIRSVWFRFIRGLVAAGVAASIKYAVDDMTSVPVDAAWIPVLTALLLAADKWVRRWSNGS